ncbi:DUF2232 domain-containing protein [Merismopedia glauca]|uniref:DUF2232 domain-containing protein n=1 Tax=Merismopedia glauca CCAP 1448/3 TaxID=1296344 RepID=A0A2T1BY93_9CYAN|nr:DUF2232 domain-containing protein [Merismopedia glauca]PSB00843.1 DUF2232 domain-containing protein [Merismopedia glauca CCAP 1448/3]
MTNNDDVWDLDIFEDDGDDADKVTPEPVSLPKKSQFQERKPLVMVETAFLASTASLIWLFDYYFPLGPLLRIFFPIPIALVYLRCGKRASWMCACVAGLLLSILMGPPRSILFFIPYGVMGVQLGACWRRKSTWGFSILMGTIIGTFGVFFRVILTSVLVGTDLWNYIITAITSFLEWLFLQLGWLIQPDQFLIQVLAIAYVILVQILYVFVVHLVALLLLDRLNNPISRPPHWVEVILDYQS